MGTGLESVLCKLYRINLQGDLLRHGDEERFKHFIPSVLDLDAISCSVLNDMQQRAVEYVLSKSKIDSDKIYPYLKCRVRHLGYENIDLDRTLHWIRYVSLYAVLYAPKCGLMRLTFQITPLDFSALVCGSVQLVFSTQNPGFLGRNCLSLRLKQIYS